MSFQIITSASNTVTKSLGAVDNIVDGVSLAMDAEEVEANKEGRKVCKKYKSGDKLGEALKSRQPFTLEYSLAH